MDKRGESQLDWIISLSLFLLYVGWFFTFITPGINFAANRDTMLVFLKSSFKDEFRWSLLEYPLFIEVNTTGLKPIITNDSSNNSIRFVDGTDFIIWESKLIFLANLSSGINTQWVVEGGNYSGAYRFKDMNTENSRVSTENLSVYFEQSMPDRVVYREDTKINGASYRLNEVSLSSLSYGYNDSGFVAIYYASTSNVNHTTFIFAYNHEIDNFITIDNPQSNYTFEISLNLDEFPSYYSSNLYFGDFSYGNSSEAINYTYDSVTLYGDKAMTIFFDNPTEINFSDYNDTLKLSLKIPLTSALNEYKYVFHEGNFTNVSRETYAVRKGVIRELTGINLGNITTNYTELHSRWRFPGQRNFDIKIYENSSGYVYASRPVKEIGTFDPKARNVISETEDYYALDEDSNLNPISISYKIW